MIDPSGVQAGTSHFSGLALGLAFLAGVAASLGPTSYALAPAVVGYGVTALNDRRNAAFRACAAVVGILFVSAATGAVAGSVGAATIAWFGSHIIALYAAGALFFALLGLRFIGLLSFHSPGTVTPKLRRIPSLAESFGLGGALAIAACPACTPLLLAVVLGAVAIGNPLGGALLLLAFGVGRAIPITALALSASWFRELRVLRPYIGWFERLGGVLLLVSAGYLAYSAWTTWALTQSSGTPMSGM